jgi:Holliday junction resolvase RusA-like endonuclease
MDATSITFEIPGDPIPQPRARFANGHTYTPDGRGLKAYKAAIGLAAAMRAKWAGWQISDGPHHVEVHAVFARPKSHLGKGGALKAKAPAFPGRNCGDLDNIEKAVWDAITKGGGVWKDDTQVTSHGGSKRYGVPGEAGRVIVEVRRPGP